MPSLKSHKSTKRKFYLSVYVVFIIGALLLLLNNKGYSDTLGYRSAELTTTKASSSSSYKISFSTVTASAIGSIKIQFCSNSPLVNSPCVAPTGFDAGSSTLSNQLGITGFNISNASNNNEIILTRNSVNTNPTAASYIFSGVINPDSVGSYYIRLTTYASIDASGAFTDYGGIAFSINEPVVVNATVPPYLTFCSGVSIGSLDCGNIQGDFIDLGELSTSTAKTGTSQILVTTNAELGYSVTAQGNTMASGVNIIPGLAFSDISRPGTSQFGINLRGNNSPNSGSDPQGSGTAQPTPNYNQVNLFRFVGGEQIISSIGPDTPRLFTVTYLANISAAQASGVYASTITYDCLADF